MNNTMNIIVEEQAQQIGILNPVAYLLNGIEIKGSNYTQLDDDKNATISFIRRNISKILEQTEVRGFIDLFRELGYENPKSAGERLLDSFYENGFKSINNIVDAYNIASLYYCSGIGMHDAREIDDIVVTRADSGNKIVPIFKSKPETIKQGDLIYKTNGKIIAWLGKRDVDSNDFKLQSDTISAVIIALGNKETSSEYNDSVCKKAMELMQKTCKNLSYDRITQIQ